MKKTIWLLILCSAITGFLLAKEYSLNSPGANNQIRINCGSEIGFRLWNKRSQVLSVNTIQLGIKGKGVLGENPSVLKTIYSTGDELLQVVVPIKFSTIRDQYNQLEIVFKSNYRLIFRAYDNGVAYRFVTQFKDDSVWVNKEEMSFDVNEEHVGPVRYYLHF